MAWKPGEIRPIVPLPKDATNSDLLEDVVYDTGQWKRGDFYDVRHHFIYRDVEQRLIRVVVPVRYADKFDPVSLKAVVDSYRVRESDGAVVVQYWDMVDR